MGGGTHEDQGKHCLYAHYCIFNSLLKVRRANLLEDAIDAFLSLDAEDYMKMYRYEFIGQEDRTN